MSARFEIVRTDAGWHSRFVATNGKTVWTTEVYKRRGGAEGAIASLGGGNNPAHRDKGHGPEIEWFGTRPWPELLEVRYVDERTEATS